MSYYLFNSDFNAFGNHFNLKIKVIIMYLDDGYECNIEIIHSDKALVDHFNFDLENNQPAIRKYYSRTHDLHLSIARVYVDAFFDFIVPKKYRHMRLNVIPLTEEISGNIKSIIYDTLTIVDTDESCRYSLFIDADTYMEVDDKCELINEFMTDFYQFDPRRFTFIDKDFTYDETEESKYDPLYHKFIKAYIQKSRDTIYKPSKSNVWFDEFVDHLLDLL